MYPARALPAFKARILVADESKEWRDHFRSMLQSAPEQPVIFEVSNAWQAIQKARELAPDIVLLDIGMPTLNGIEAAKQIHQESTVSRVVLLMQNGNEEDIGWALCYSCASGCVVKADAATKLCSTITTMLRLKGVLLWTVPSLNFRYSPTMCRLA